MHGRLVWFGVAVVACASGTLAAVGLWARSDFWRTAVPGYLTGFGTLALAALTYALMRRESADRRALIAAQDDIRNADKAAQDAATEAHALSEARKVISQLATREGEVPAPVVFGSEAVPWPTTIWSVIEVLNASNDPILDLKLIAGLPVPDAGDVPGRGSASDLLWAPAPGESGRYEPCTLAGASHDFQGQWLRPVRDREPAGQPFEREVPAGPEKEMLQATIAWTDSRGFGWMRVGRDQPIRLDEPLRWTEAEWRSLSRGVNAAT